MYNTEYICTYHEVSDLDESNKQYRADLLAVFNVVDESHLVERIEKIYEQIECKSLVELVQHHSLAMFCESEIMLFIVLFNYDYFHFTHKFICEYLTTKRQGINYGHLENLLKKTT